MQTKLVPPLVPAIRVVMIAVSLSRADERGRVQYDWKIIPCRFCHRTTHEAAFHCSMQSPIAARRRNDPSSAGMGHSRAGGGEAAVQAMLGSGPWAGLEADYVGPLACDAGPQDAPPRAGCQPLACADRSVWTFRIYSNRLISRLSAEPCNSHWGARQVSFVPTTANAPESPRRIHASLGGGRLVRICPRIREWLGLLRLRVCFSVGLGRRKTGIAAQALGTLLSRRPGQRRSQQMKSVVCWKPVRPLAGFLVG
jgi:hypothetical protein